VTTFSPATDRDANTAGVKGARCLACGHSLSKEPALVSRDRMHGIPGVWPVHECRTCGSGTTLPVADPSALAAFYPARYAPFELQRGPLARTMAAMQRARDKRFPMSDLRGGRQSGRLLDVGCGRGDLAASWIEAGWEVRGIEPSPEAAAVATSRGAAVSVGTLDTVVLEPASVDAVVFRHSLEHVADPRKDLRRVFAALHPGGRIAVLVPNWGSWQRRLFGEFWFPLELPRHRTHFTAMGLRAALHAAGFQDVWIEPGSPLITTAWSLQFRLFGRCLTESGVPLLAGYAASIPIGGAARLVDLALRSGDFLHAVASRGAD
jgi:SAM-dependent methyltransferase